MSVSMLGSSAALLAALARSQAPAASATALFRNQQADAAAAGTSGPRDFDFLFGRWRVHNERLRERLVGCEDWQRFDAILECRPILGGVGNVDEFVTDEFGPGVFHGLSLRLFDPAARNWRIWWASNHGGQLEPPVIGGFAGGVGRFEGEDVHDGTPVRVRYLWSGTASERPRWEQAFSTDAGRRWETNWRMRLERLGHGERGVAA